MDKNGFSAERFVQQQVECDEALRPFTAVARALRSAAGTAGLDGDALLGVAIAQDSGGIGTLLDECLGRVHEIGGYPEKPDSPVEDSSAPQLRASA